MNATAMRPFGPLRMASITRESEKAAAYPERCKSNFDSSMLPETSAASTRRRSTRSAARLEVQPVVAISAASTKVRTTRIMLEPCSLCCEQLGLMSFFFNQLKSQWRSYGTSRFASLLSNVQNDLKHSSENSANPIFRVELSALLFSASIPRPTSHESGARRLCRQARH